MPVNQKTVPDYSNCFFNAIWIGLFLSMYSNSAFGIISGSNEYHWKDDHLLYQKETVGRLCDVLPQGLNLKRSIKKINNNLFVVTNFLKAGKKLDSVSFSFNFVHAGTPRYLMIPSVSYNGNQWGKGLEPKGFTQDGVVRSFEYRRSSIPGSTYSEAENHTIAVWGQEQKQQGDLMFSCSLNPSQTQVTHSLIYPDEERPDCYSLRDVYTAPYKNFISFKSGDELTIIFYVYADHTKKNHRSMRGFLDNAWQIAEKPTFNIPSAGQIWDMAIDYANNSLWCEEGIYKGFGIGLVPNPEGGFSPRGGWKYEIGWCGNNAAFANAFLYDYLKNNHQESLEKALKCLDTWSTNTVLRNGLFITHYDNILGNNEGILDACNLGYAASGFFDASELCSLTGNERPELKKIAFGICDFMVNDQQESGQYGKGWKYDGVCTYRDGTIGAFLIAPMIQAYRISNDEKYLKSACIAFDFYMGELLSKGYTTAGALDTWCIDCESAMPLLRAAMLLFEVTGDLKYIDHAESVSYYIATWQWHYNAFYPASNDFTKYGYNTFGASGVSVQHHHITSYTVCMVEYWIELSLLTKNPVWKERALAIWRNSAQLISDSTLVIHDRIRPRGSQNEAFYQSNWSFDYDKSESINDWLVAWPSAFRLETLRRIKNWSELK